MLGLYTCATPQSVLRWQLSYLASDLQYLGKQDKKSYTASLTEEHQDKISRVPSNSVTEGLRPGPCGWENRVEEHLGFSAGLWE